MKLSLLIADADGSLAAAFRHYLPSCYQVETAQGGVECLAKLRNWAPDVLLLAESLPWGGSDGVLDGMRGDLSLRDIPVLLMTDEMRAENLGQLRLPPVVDWLAKPFALTALLDSIRAAAFPFRTGESEPVDDADKEDGSRDAYQQPHRFEQPRNTHRRPLSKEDPSCSC